MAWIPSQASPRNTHIFYKIIFEIANFPEDQLCQNFDQEAYLCKLCHHEYFKTKMVDLKNVCLFLFYFLKEKKNSASFQDFPLNQVSLLSEDSLYVLSKLANFYTNINHV